MLLIVYENSTTDLQLPHGTTTLTFMTMIYDYGTVSHLIACDGERIEML